MIVKFRKKFLILLILVGIIAFENVYATNYENQVNYDEVYIDENYTKKISIESIAKHLYISPSTLAHKFRKELNITIYQYISKKRVLYVQKLVKKGESYSEAAIKSGFSDYSCFYRIYKKYYKTD